MQFSIQDHFPVYSVFLLILIISAAYLIQVLPCRLRRELTTNFYLKHTFSYMTMVFFVVMTTPVKSNKIYDILKMSGFLYAFFILLTKTDYMFFVSILGIISIIYILVLRKSEIKDEIDELNKTAHTNNPPLAKSDEISIKTKQNEYDTIVAVNNGLFISIIPLFIVGFIISVGKKKLQYKNNFDIIKLLVGTGECKPTRVELNVDKVSFINAFRAAF
jgi:hypothetical protein